jgi:hypothetical protein
MLIQQILSRHPAFFGNQLEKQTFSKELELAYLKQSAETITIC